MEELHTSIYSNICELPEMSENNFFHSRQYFSICYDIPGLQPYLVTVETEEHKVLGQLVAVIKARKSWFPPYIYSHCRIIGEGEYDTSCPYQKEDLFGMMLDELTKNIHNKVLFTEFSNLSHKMFGYKHFRQNGFYPVNWINVHNSLHNKTPEERATAKTKKKIRTALQKDIVIKEVENSEELSQFYKLLKKHNVFKPKRYIPDKKFFENLLNCKIAKLIVTKHNNNVIGCCAFVFNQGNAYLWYSAALRKSYLPYHPDISTIWHAIKYAHNINLNHFIFMDVGLPYKQNPYLDFILGFGGKTISAFRWFRFSPKWLNSIFAYFKFSKI